MWFRCTCIELKKCYEQYQMYVVVGALAELSGVCQSMPLSSMLIIDITNELNCKYCVFYVH